MRKIITSLAGVLLLACGTDFTPEDPEVPENPGTEIPNPDDPGDTPTPEQPTEIPVTVDAQIPAYADQRATDASADAVVAGDADYWENAAFTRSVAVVYNGADAQVTVPAEVAVWQDGAHVVLDLSSAPGTQVALSGSSDDGSLKVYASDRWKLVLEGVQLASQSGPAINNQGKSGVYIHLAEGTENSLTDGSSYGDDGYYPEGVGSDDEDRKGCLFSEGAICFSGSGMLQIAGRKKHAVASDNAIRMRPGVTLAVTESGKNGVHAKGDVRIDGGLLYVSVSGEAAKCIKTDGNVTVGGGRLQLYTVGEAYYDEDEEDTSSSAGIKNDGDLLVTGGQIVAKATGEGGKGLNVDGTMTVSGGEVYVVTTGGKYVYSEPLDLTASPKGVKSDGDMLITDGVVAVWVLGVSDGSEGIESKSSMRITGGRVESYAYEDAINAATSFAVEGGQVGAYSVTADGIDSNGPISVSGGVVIASGAGMPEDGFDCDQSTFAVTGGVLVGTGGTTSTPTSSACTQRTVICNGLSATEGTPIRIVSESGEVLLAYTLPRTMSSLCLLFSSPSLAQGSYTVYTGGSVEEYADEWYGYYTGATCTGGSQATTFTVSSMVTTVGGQGGGGGDRPGAGPR